MATIKRFEDLEIWKKARELSQAIYEKTLVGSFAKDYGLRDQINRSSGSIMDNIAEGFERDGKGEFVQFLSIAKSSAGEVRSQLYRALDRKHLSTEEFEVLKGKAEEVSKGLSGFIHYLKSSEIKGTKYKASESIIEFKTTDQSEI